MPEPLNVPPTNPPADDPNKGLASILEGLTKLSDSVASITERLDSVDETVAGLKPAEPVTPEPAPGAPVEPKWKPKSWDEFPTKAEEIADAVVERKLKEKDEAAIKANEDKEKEALLLKAQIDTDFDNQFEVLEKNKVIPPVKDVNSADDEGKRVRKELFALGIKYNSPDLVAMAQLREEWVGNGYTLDLNIEKPEQSKWIKSNPRPFGAGAPVGSSSAAGKSGTQPTYKEIHGLSMDEMIRRYNA